MIEAGHKEISIHRQCELLSVPRSTVYYFNTDQGSQFTSDELLEELKENHIIISTDGKGRTLDNVYVERLWRSLKYENIHLNDYGSLSELRTGVGDYFRFFNSERPHQSFEYRTPDEIYYEACGKIVNKGA